MASGPLQVPPGGEEAQGLRPLSLGDPAKQNQLK